MLGARVVGYSLDPPTDPSHFGALELGKRVTEDARADVRSLETFQGMLRRHKPEFVFHLAAQPLVRRAFNEPHYTVDTNVMGSVNVLEAVRRENRSCIVIMITTDKVYENAEWVYAYRENDRLGGHDPYSASKACAEIMISSYHRSFFRGRGSNDGKPVIAVASCRGGNVVGGGDWAEDRIIPDCMRSLAANRPIPIRNRHSIRPWQHVLELASGYLYLGAKISAALRKEDWQRFEELCSAFNFGPEIGSRKTVGELVQAVLSHWPGKAQDFTDPNARYEAGRLSLTIDKACDTLGWRPRWDFAETVKQTVEWYRRYYGAETRGPAFVRDLTQQQIRSYSEGLNDEVHD
jgi:CDP-glucose 4,6-dehydratase